MRTLGLILSLLALVLEGTMAIPVLGGTLVIASAYILLIVAFIVHAGVLTVRILDKGKDGGSYVSPIFGLVTSVLAWIPFVGFAMHVVTFILYIIDFAKKRA